MLAFVAVLRKQQVEAIAKVPGVDVLFVGPFDLGNNIGHPILDGTMHSELKDAIRRIHRAASENGKKTGIYCTSGEQARQYADEGFHMVSFLIRLLVRASACEYQGLALHSLSHPQALWPHELVFVYTR